MTALVVLASGSGSNLQAVIDAGLDVRAVVSDRAASGALERARRHGIAAHHLPASAAPTRRDYDHALADLVAVHRPDVVVLAGWMRILTSAFLDRFPCVVNLHPALPGELPGTAAIARAHAQAQAGTRTRSGVMVHLVPDERVDEGPVLAVTEVPCLPGDDLDTFAARMHAAEHHLLVAVLRDPSLLRSTLRDGGAPHLPDEPAHTIQEARR